MEQAELNFYVTTLQKKMNDYFTQSIVLESKIQYQNEIIQKQQLKIEELKTSCQDYESQVEGLSQKLKEETSKPIPLNTAVNRSKNKTSQESDGGSF